MTISGNYNTEKREVSIVKRILDECGIRYESVQKHLKADDADVMVTISDGKSFLIEVKEEDYETRFKKYGELGIDFISAFYFKDPVSVSKWKGSPKRPSMLSAFLSAVDKESSFKWGKIEYSKAHLWLFFVDVNGKIKYWFYDGKGMTSDEFKDYLCDNCMFAVNNKPSSQDSYYDRHNSACFFIKPDNEFLQRYSVDIGQYIKEM